MTNETRALRHPDGRDPREDAAVKFRAGQDPEFGELYARPDETIGPEARALVADLIQRAEGVVEDQLYGVLWDVVAGLARHYPSIGPSFHVVAQHILEAHSPERCGLFLDGKAAAEWVECVGLVPAPGDQAPAA